MIKIFKSEYVQSVCGVLFLLIILPVLGAVELARILQDKILKIIKKTRKEEEKL
jgi:hypothetical protein